MDVRASLPFQEFHPGYYHAAPTTERERIRQHGLMPSHPAQSGRWDESFGDDDDWKDEWGRGIPTGVYVHRTPELAQEYAQALERSWMDDRRAQYDIWHVPGNQVKDAVIDPDLVGMFDKHDDPLAITHPVRPNLFRPYEHTVDPAVWKDYVNEPKYRREMPHLYGEPRSSAFWNKDTDMHRGSAIKELHPSLRPLIPCECQGRLGDKCPECRGTQQVRPDLREVMVPDNPWHWSVPYRIPQLDQRDLAQTRGASLNRTALPVKWTRSIDSITTAHRPHQPQASGALIELRQALGLTPDANLPATEAGIGVDSCIYSNGSMAPNNSDTNSNTNNVETLPSEPGALGGWDNVTSPERTRPAILEPGSGSSSISDSDMRTYSDSTSAGVSVNGEGMPYGVNRPSFKEFLSHRSIRESTKFAPERGKFFSNNGTPDGNPAGDDQVPDQPIANPDKFFTSETQHERRKRNWLEWLWKKSTADPDWVNQWMAKNGPYMYHATTREAMPKIVNEGLFPHDHLGTGEAAWKCATCDYDHGHEPSPEEKTDHGMMPCPSCGNNYVQEHVDHSNSSYKGGYWEPRQGHVYLGTKDYASRYAANRPDPAMVRVDLRKLDPTYFSADEDHWHPSNPNINYNHPAVKDVYDYEPPPSPYDYSDGDQNLGEWADQINLGNNEDETHYSMDQGSLAYNGHIPAEAIEHVSPYNHEPYQYDSEGKPFVALSGWDNSIGTPDGTRVPVVEVRTPSDPSHEAESARPMIYSRDHDKIWMGSPGSAHASIIRFVPELDYSAYSGPAHRPRGVHHGVMDDGKAYWYGQESQTWDQVFSASMPSWQGPNMPVIKTWDGQLYWGDYLHADAARRNSLGIDQLKDAQFGRGHPESPDSIRWMTRSPHDTQNRMMDENDLWDEHGYKVNQSKGLPIWDQMFSKVAAWTIQCDQCHGKGGESFEGSWFKCRRCAGKGWLPVGGEGQSIGDFMNYPMTELDSALPRNFGRLATPVPQLREHQIPNHADASMWGREYLNRRPMVYDPVQNVIHLGTPGGIHADLVRGANLIGHAGVHHNENSIHYGWLGHNPESTKIDWVEGKGKNEYGWAGEHPGPHVDEALKHLRAAPEPEQEWEQMFLASWPAQPPEDITGVTQQNGGHEVPGRVHRDPERIVTEPWSEGREGKGLFVTTPKGHVFHTWATNEGWPHHQHVSELYRQNLDTVGYSSGYEIRPDRTVTSPYETNYDKLLPHPFKQGLGNWQQMFGAVHWDGNEGRWVDTVKPDVPIIQPHWPPTNGAYAEMGEEDFKHRVPVIFDGTKVLLGNKGDLHSDIIREHGLEDYGFPRGSYLPNGGFNKPPGELSWFNRKPKPEWDAAIREKLQADSPADESWADVFGDPRSIWTEKNAAYDELPEVVEGHRPAEQSVFAGQWGIPDRTGERPIVWHHPTDTIYVGQPNTHHADVIDEHGLDRDEYQDPQQMTVEDSPRQWTSDEIGGPEGEHLEHLTFAYITPSVLNPNARRLRTWGPFSESGKQALVRANLLDKTKSQEDWDQMFSKVANWETDANPSPQNPHPFNYDITTWRPGNKGKGLVSPEGRAYAWKTTNEFDGRPSHGQALTTLGYGVSEPEDGSYHDYEDAASTKAMQGDWSFYDINHDGTFRQMFGPSEHKAIMKAHLPQEPRCEGCGEPVRPDREGDYMCPNCQYSGTYMGDMDDQTWGQMFSSMGDGGPNFVWHDAGEMDPGRGKDYQADHSMLYDPATDTVHIGTETLQHADLYDKTGNNPSFQPAYVYDGTFGSDRMDEQAHDRLYNLFNRIHFNTFGENLINSKEGNWGEMFSKLAQYPEEIKRDIDPKELEPDKFYTSEEEHEKSKKLFPLPEANPWGPDWIKEAAAQEQWLQDWIAKNGPYMVHETDPGAYRKIIREGLLPHDTLSSGSKYQDQPHLIPRANHVYLQHPGRGGMNLFHEDNTHHVVVDLRKLNPYQITADEDAFMRLRQEHRDKGWPAGREEPVLDENGRPIAIPNRSEALRQIRYGPNPEQVVPSWGAFADKFHLDNNEHTAHSLNSMATMAYQGGIHPSQFTPMNVAHQELRNWTPSGGEKGELWSNPTVDHEWPDEPGVLHPGNPDSWPSEWNPAVPVPWDGMHYFQRMLADRGLNKAAMAADPYWLDHWMERNGPYLYHSTHPDNLDSILQSGLLPWDHPNNPSGSVYNGTLTPRPGHVYMRPTPRNADTTVRVDLRKLDPGLMNPDEDNMVGNTPWNLPKPELIEEHPSGLRSLDRYETGGMWAERHQMDNPSQTAWSLDNPKKMGAPTMAYRGIVPPQALSRINEAEAY